MVVRKVGPFVIEKPKRKRVSNEKELQNRLENLRIKLSYSKSQEKFLENYLLEEEKMKVFLNQQLRENDKQIASLIQDLEWGEIMIKR